MLCSAALSHYVGFLLLFFLIWYQAFLSVHIIAEHRIFENSLETSALKPLLQMSSNLSLLILPPTTPSVLWPEGSHQMRNYILKILLFLNPLLLLGLNPIIWNGELTALSEDNIHNISGPRCQTRDPHCIQPGASLLTGFSISWCLSFSTLLQVLPPSPKSHFFHLSMLKNQPNKKPQWKQPTIFYCTLNVLRVSMKFSFGTLQVHLLAQPALPVLHGVPPWMLEWILAQNVL